MKRGRSATHITKSHHSCIRLRKGEWASQESKRSTLFIFSSTRRNNDKGKHQDDEVMLLFAPFGLKFAHVRTTTKIVLVATSAAEIKGHPTGTWLEEVATPYYLFKDSGSEVVIASPAGGPIPIDQRSLGEGFFTDGAKKFMVRSLNVMSFNHWHGTLISLF
jgi:hypothetical protein